MIVLLMVDPPCCLLQEDLTSWHREISGATVAMCLHFSCSVHCTAARGALMKNAGGFPLSRDESQFLFDLAYHIGDDRFF